MRKLTKAALLCAVVTMPAMAQADDHQCGKVTITEMNWASGSVDTNIAAFLMRQGYGCDVTIVPSDTVPAITSVAENGEPDIVTELWLNSTGKVYDQLESEGKIERVGKMLTPGGIEGWWIPTYLAKEHPELKTIQGVMKNPELVGNRFNNCPQGWGCRVVSDNLIRALDLEKSGIKVYNHGSGETLASSMGAAYENHEPWFGYYWGPTIPLGKYDMTRVSLGEYKPKINNANQTPNAKNPGVSGFTSAPILTAVTTDFKKREPEIAEFLSKMTIQTDKMGKLLAWKSEHGATGEETAVHYIQNNPDIWSKWLNDSARKKLSNLIDK